MKSLFVSDVSLEKSIEGNTLKQIEFYPREPRLI